MNIRTLFAYTVVIFAVGPTISYSQIAQPLVEGATKITGAGPIDVDLQLWDLDAAKPLAVIGGPIRATAAAGGGAAGSFTATLQNPLVAGQNIQLQQVPAGTTPEAGTPVGTPVTVGGIADWGRVRATFAAGTVLSADNGFQGQNVTQSSLFLDFNVEKNWRWGGVDAQKNWQRRLLFSTFFETRLTSIPQTTTATTTAPASAGGGTNTTPDTLSTFISSQKSALMQGGAYFPYLVQKWTWQNAPNALFIAPLAKVGFITPVGSVTTQTTTQSGTSTVQPLNPQQFYNYYGWGGRIGHYKLSYDSINEAPELISYIDVIVGRFSNLETLAPVPHGSGTYPIRQYRIAIDGSLKVPATPFLVGFSANIGQNLLLQPHTLAAKDDLRFFFGTKFDVGKLFGKLAQF